MKMLNNNMFIKALENLDSRYSKRNSAPYFVKKFFLDDFPKKAEISICALGMGYAYINGKRVSDDLFTAPVSDYRKTLWYHTYDITALLAKGENKIEVICGNGFYNESCPNAWESEKAPWRDVPKVALELTADDQLILRTDSDWLCAENTAIIYNNLRTGEIFDSRLSRKNSILPAENIELKSAIVDKNPPHGVFRQCMCEGIREKDLITAEKIIKKGEKYIYDFGKNISGYARLCVSGNPGDEITLKYFEEFDEYGEIADKDMSRLYPESDFQTDRFLCCGEERTWSPCFTYHGFRYIEATGLKNPNKNTLIAVFVHQDIERRSDFSCSNEFLNKLFNYGITSCYSNMFYMPTDCPTREKYGWMNDAQSSMEQFFTDFSCKRLMEKWNQDICDAMNEDGALPGIVPTHGWGFHWGNGPVSDGTLFEIPYRLWLHTGDDKLLKENFPYFKKYLAHIKRMENDKGFVDSGLHDWANPDDNSQKVPVELINALLCIKFYRIARLAAERCGEHAEEFQIEEQRLKNAVLNEYFNANHECIIEEQTAIAMLIYYGVYPNWNTIKNQLKKSVQEKNFHHCCGMVGLRHLYAALNICGLEEYAYKIITADGYPSYKSWMHKGATTLWEMWTGTDSKNHHMYSDVLSWLIKTVLGIGRDENQCSYSSVTVKPYFFSDLSYATGYQQLKDGTVEVSWKRNENKILLNLKISGNLSVIYDGKRLSQGEYAFEEIC